MVSWDVDDVPTLGVLGVSTLGDGQLFKISVSKLMHNFDMLHFQLSWKGLSFF